MATSPTFGSAAPFTGSALVSATANTALSAPGVTGNVSIYTAAASGAKIEEIDLVMIGTGLVGVIYIWRWVGGAGANYFLVDSIAVNTTLTAGMVLPLIYANLQLNAGDVLTCTSSVANQPAQINAYGGSY